jgi:hypothetical protein
LLPTSLRVFRPASESGLEAGLHAIANGSGTGGHFPKSPFTTTSLFYCCIERSRRLPKIAVTGASTV